MTRAKDKAAWVKAWQTETRYLFRSYQCRANSAQYERLSEAIKGVITVIEEIAERMENEGEWDKNKGKPSG